MKLKSLEVEGGEKGKPKGREGQGEEPRPKSRCKFFLTKSGCRRGKECTWAHDEKDGKRRCYVCGSTEHLATTCTRPKTPADGSPKKQKGAKVEGEDQSPKASEETPKGGADPALKDLLDEASKMLKSLSSSSSTTSAKEEKHRTTRRTSCSACNSS